MTTAGFESPPSNSSRPTFPGARLTIIPGERAALELLENRVHRRVFASVHRVELLNNLVFAPQIRLKRTPVELAPRDPPPRGIPLGHLVDGVRYRYGDLQGGSMTVVIPAVNR